jgi:hypothetical protein
MLQFSRGEHRASMDVRRLWTNLDVFSFVDLIVVPYVTIRSSC